MGKRSKAFTVVHVETPNNKKHQACGLIDKLKRQGVIVPTTPDKYLAFAHFVTNQDGQTLRLVTNFTEINKLTRRIPHGYPMAQELRNALKPGTTLLMQVDCM